MTGSMYAAISGMKTHMNKLSVIGNNIANINTVGFKSQRTLFRDTMYTMYSSGSNGTDVKGGLNPSQIGYGSQIGTIDLNMAGGTFAPGSNMDCMIAGDGFFMVGDKDVAGVIDPTDPNSFKSLNMTRVGDFKFGPDGYLTDGSGGTVYGFMAVGVDKEGNPIISDQLVPIRLPRIERVAVALKDVGNVKQGEELYKNEITANMMEGTDYKYVNKIRYPSMGENFNQALQDTWPMPDDRNGVVDTTGENTLPFATMNSISIDPVTGRISGVLKDTKEWVTIGFLAVGNVTNPSGVTHEDGYYYSCGDGAGDLEIGMLGNAEKELKKPTGVDANGDLILSDLTYVNASLMQAGAEASQKSLIKSGGKTGLNVGGLEGSNVDLATEISEMITTQRGYQANTRIITVTDSMLEELVNIKR